MANTITKITYDGNDYEVWTWDVVWPASATDWHLAVFDWATGKLIKDGGVIPAGDVQVSSQTGNILTSWMKIWAGEETDYSNLWTYDNNTIYLTIPDSN